MTAYFTDPMGDEFKKAIEEAMVELDKEQSKKGSTPKNEGKTKQSASVGGKKKPTRSKMKQKSLSRKTRNSLK